MIFSAWINPIKPFQCSNKLIRNLEKNLFLLIRSVYFRKKSTIFIIFLVIIKRVIVVKWGNVVIMKIHFCSIMMVQHTIHIPNTVLVHYCKSFYWKIFYFNKKSNNTYWKREREREFFYYLNLDHFNKDPKVKYLFAKELFNYTIESIVSSFIFFCRSFSYCS
jgi:hypothetical protein